MKFNTFLRTFFSETLLIYGRPLLSTLLLLHPTTHDHGYMSDVCNERELLGDEGERGVYSIKRFLLRLHTTKRRPKIFWQKNEYNKSAAPFVRERETGFRSLVPRVNWIVFLISMETGGWRVGCQEQRSEYCLIYWGMEIITLPGMGSGGGEREWLFWDYLTPRAN